ncbi:MAG: NAD-dependent epimerase/dehydratase family protein [Ignavibacteriaceae bacterium]|nr:NAD-dependent epimerase/dehydratase family protein [Ignavibacteriaceae bacterium]
MGTHLYNFFGLQNGVERIPFRDEYFSSQNDLENFVAQCDVIVHLAAMNRHGDPQVIYDTNIGLVKSLIAASEKTSSKAHILFSSSTQEERDNLYGKSKREGRKILEQWAVQNNSSFTGMIIPNVFGPFGNPYYNSVIATFCHQLSRGQTPKIEIDGELKLIYINELVGEFWKKIIEKSKGDNFTAVEMYEVPFSKTIKVSEILVLLKSYQDLYMVNGIIPSLQSNFEVGLFNTFRCYIPSEHYPVKLKLNTDNRGTFVEILRSGMPGQYSFSTTKPGITRGNHFHTRKIERFAVIKGKAEIELRRIGTNDKIVYQLDGNEPAFVDMPVWHTHNIKNTGNEELVTLFWINEPYNPDDPDTWFEVV